MFTSAYVRLKIYLWCHFSQGIMMMISIITITIFRFPEHCKLEATISLTNYFYAAQLTFIRLHISCDYHYIDLSSFEIPSMRLYVPNLSFLGSTVVFHAGLMSYPLSFQGVCFLVYIAYTTFHVNYVFTSISFLCCRGNATSTGR